MEKKKREVYIKRRVKKALGACLLFGVIAALEIELTALGAEMSAAPSGTLRIVRPLETEEAERFTAPPEEYTDEDGMVYELEDWQLERLPGGQVSQEVRRQVVYRDVEAAQSVPQSIPVREQYTGSSGPSSSAAPIPQGSDSSFQASGTLAATETQALGERWSDDFHVPLVFHSYGAELYELGNILMSAQDGFPPPEEYQDELLGILGLPGEDYEITGLTWDSEPYAGPDGELCREATASGRKRLVDYQVTYDGRVSWQMPDTWQLETVYRLRPSVVAAEESTAEALPAAGAPVMDADSLTEPGLWYWVRSGFVITVAAGLVGITVGILILFVMWLKRERSERQDKAHLAD